MATIYPYIRIQCYIENSGCVNLEVRGSRQGDIQKLALMAKKLSPRRPRELNMSPTDTRMGAVISADRSCCHTRYVVREPHLHAIGRPRSLLRFPLHELGERGNVPPRGLVEPPVHGNGSGRHTDRLRLLPAVAVVLLAGG
jgi:hypothetical protein